MRISQCLFALVSVSLSACGLQPLNASYNSAYGGFAVDPNSLGVPTANTVVCNVSSATVASSGIVTMILSGSGGTPGYNIASLSISSNSGTVVGQLVSSSPYFPSSGTVQVYFSGFTSLVGQSGTVQITDSASPAGGGTCGFTITTN